jgi:Ice-binding-like/Secretion system C-terminal sorting domain
MKKSLLICLSVFMLVVISSNAFAQSLGSAAGFALFSSNGAVSNTGTSHLTGNVGTNNGSSTEFGNVDGVMHDNDGASLLCATDLLIAYQQLDSAIPTDFHAALLGNGQTLDAGTYSIGESATLNLELILDGEGDANAKFIFQIDGAFSSGAGAHVTLINNAQACNVFWKVDGLVSLASETSMKGTIIANNAAIVLSSGVVLEGRALSTTGAVTVDGVTVRTPVGCGSPLLTGPAAPALASVECYVLFSGNGEVTNSGVSHVTGDIGTNVGLTTGFDDLNVTGTIHENPDTSTAQCAADLSTVYSYLHLLPVDIELLYPADFGNSLVLTPHTYVLDAATVLTNTVILNAQDNANAVFVIKINGAFSTSTHAKVLLENGAQQENVFWVIEGAVDINDYAEIKGTIVCNNAAINLNTGTILKGRALTTDGALLTEAIIATMPLGCDTMGTGEIAVADPAAFYPNPFSNTITITNVSDNSSELYIYNSLGGIVMSRTITETTTTLETNLSSGIYFYRLINSNGAVQTGKLVSAN